MQSLRRGWALVKGARRMEWIALAAAIAILVLVLIGDGEAPGVLVMAEGGGDIRVALELSRAVSTLLGVSNDRIEVLKMDGSGS